MKFLIFMTTFIWALTLGLGQTAQVVRVEPTETKKPGNVTTSKPATTEETLAPEIEPPSNSTSQTPTNTTTKSSSALPPSSTSTPTAASTISPASSSSSSSTSSSSSSSSPPVSGGDPKETSFLLRLRTLNAARTESDGSSRSLQFQTLLAHINIPFQVRNSTMSSSDGSGGGGDESQFQLNQIKEYLMHLVQAIRELAESRRRETANDVEQPITDQSEIQEDAATATPLMPSPQTLPYVC